MRRVRRGCAIVVLFAVAVAMAVGQSDSAGSVTEIEVRESAREALSDPVRITTEGRGIFHGRLLAVLEDRVEIVTADGRIVQIAVSEIDSLESVDELGGRNALYQDAAANRLVVMPTGFPIERGEFHVTNQEIAVVTSTYGVTDHFSVWGGISIPGLVLSGRFSFMPAETVGLSAGAFIGAEWSEFNTVALPYGLVSFGSPNRNITVGGGGIFSITGDDRDFFDGLVLAIGGKAIFTPTAALVFESWSIWMDGDDSILFTPSAVFRIAGDRLSWDLGAVVPLSLDWSGSSPNFGGAFGDTVIPLPLLSITYRID